MDENVRLNRRARARPAYDLRRKVLLKNFLREQMSPSSIRSSSGISINTENLLPVVIQNSSDNRNVDIESIDNSSEQEHVTQASPQDSMDTPISEEKSDEIREDPLPKRKSTLIFDFSKITELKLSRLNPLKRKSPALSEEDVKRISKTYEVKGKNEENSKNEVPKSPSKKEVKVIESKVNHISAHLKIIKKSREKRRQGIAKAKHVLKTIQSPFKRIQFRSKSFRTELDKMFGNLKTSMDQKVNEEEKVELKDEDSKSSKKKNSKGSPSAWTVEADGIKLKIHSKEPKTLAKNSCEASTFTWSVGTEDEENEEKLWSWEKNMDKRLFSLQFEERGKIKLVRKESSSSSIKRPIDRNIDLIPHKRPKIYNTSSQSIQTDISWSLHEIRKLERANRRLREENKLLSESLSSIMSDVDVSFNPYQRNRETCSYSSPTRNVSFYSDAQRSDMYNVDPMKVRVTRSRSVQERAERRHEIKLRLSSRSMCHRQYARESPNSLYRAKPCIITPCSTPNAPLYQPRSSPVLRSLPEHNYGKSLNRRSSMPEGKYRRPVVNRRSSYVQDIQAPRKRHSLLALPTEAFY